MPSTDDAVEWMQYAAASPSRWRSLLRSAQTEDMRRQDMAFQETPAQVQEIHAEIHICAECGADFGKASSFRAHFARQHVSSVERQFACGDSCRACLKRFSSRAHVIYHLAVSKRGCLDLLMVRRPPLSADEVARLDEEDRTQRRAARASGRAPRRAYWPAIQLPGPLLRAIPVPITPPGTPPPEAEDSVPGRWPQQPPASTEVVDLT